MKYWKYQGFYIETTKEQQVTKSMCRGVVGECLNFFSIIINIFFITALIFYHYTGMMIKNLPLQQSVLKQGKANALWGTNRNSLFHKLSKPSKCMNFRAGYHHGYLKQILETVFMGHDDLKKKMTQLIK